MTTKEKEAKIQQYMKALDVSREEAIQLIEDDENDVIGEEGEQLQEKAKEVRRYEKSDKPRKKAVKERKVDEEKKHLIEILAEAITHSAPAENISIKNEAEISFSYGENSYTIKLVKHRPPKK